MTTGEEVARVLEEALELMNDSGAHWTKGTYRELNDQGEMSYCAVGAVCAIVNQNPYDGYKHNVLAEGALRALASAYRPLRNEHAYHYRVVTWNDSARTKWDDVVRRFRKAAAKARKGI